MIVKLEELKKIRNLLKSEGKKVVFTNGCFDIIHRGHIEYLQQAKDLGDVLVVGLNSDTSMKRLKGEKRPLINQEDRAIILSALCSVDYVVIFSDDTPAKLIEALVPDVLVKGGDYDISEIVGREVVWKNGGEVKVIPVVPGRSTKGIIAEILERYA